MLSATRTGTAEGSHEQAHEQEWQRDTDFQVLEDSSLDHDPIISYEDFCRDFSPPITAHKSESETGTLASAFKTESEPLGWEPALGVNSPKYSSSESECSQDTVIPSFFKNVFDTENNNLAPPLPQCAPFERRDNDASTADFAANSRKRPSDYALATKSVENNAVWAKKKAKTHAGKQEKPGIQYACPFQKLDPVKHHECLKYALHRIKDVKQHVYRRHKQPDYYCARCFVVFLNADARDEHARSKDCENKQAPTFEGITDAVKIELNKSPSRGLDAQQQWFKMWNIIFPREEKPSSVFVGSYMEEMVPVLRSLWTRRSSSILAMAQRDQPSPVNQYLLDAVAELIFGFLEAEASTLLAEKTRGYDLPNQHILMDAGSAMFTQASTVIEESPNLLHTSPPYFLQHSNGGPEAEFEIGSHVAFGEG